MHIVILGGGGFIGKRLAKELIEKGGIVRGEVIRLTLLDVGFPDDMPADSRVECIAADFSENVLLNILCKNRMSSFILPQL
jgi:nucleoside-diphosphate-sugar epimerase